MYIKRDSLNNIVAVSHLPEAGMLPATLEDMDQVQAYLQQFANESKFQFQQSDLAMARVLEDVVNLLVEQGTIRFTDLPPAAQQKLLARREMRGKHVSVDLIDDNDYLNI